ncbi:hypothetical protein [Sporolactobacillus pectinivorans]|uniref:hypothetical protein n=1 Tax=Sporolactobacillus pectinivorans TaxID=1591408 RepID=UPI000C2630E8|nr:hypothetical protein [Sporolactobacillus pectinivorans]
MKRYLGVVNIKGFIEFHTGNDSYRILLKIDDINMIFETEDARARIYLENGEDYYTYESYDEIRSAIQEAWDD